MTDRLAELTAGTGISLEDDMVTVDLENGNDEEEIDDETREALEQYYKESDALSRAIDKIHEKVQTIESRYQVTMSNDLDDSDKAIAANDIARLLDQTQKTSEAIRRRLRRIAGENKEFANEFPHKTGELRIRVNTHTGLIRRFMDAMQLFEEAQEKHRNNVKTVMERHLRMMNPDATEEEIQEAMRNGITDGVVDDSPTLAQLPPEEQARLRRGLADLKNRNNDIKKLEESIIELHQLFVDMQIMVEAQGELLNDIEYNIEETKGKTEQGLQELVQARAHQKSANRKKIFCIILFIIVVLVVMIPILVKYIPIWFPGTKETIDNLPIVGSGGNQNETDSTSDSPGGDDTSSEPQPGREIAIMDSKTFVVGSQTISMKSLRAAKKRKEAPGASLPVSAEVVTKMQPRSYRAEEKSFDRRGFLLRRSASQNHVAHRTLFPRNTANGELSAMYSTRYKKMSKRKPWLHNAQRNEVFEIMPRKNVLKRRYTNRRRRVPNAQKASRTESTLPAVSSVVDHVSFSILRLLRALSDIAYQFRRSSTLRRGRSGSGNSSRQDLRSPSETTCAVL